MRVRAQFSSQLMCVSVLVASACGSSAAGPDAQPSPSSVVSDQSASDQSASGQSAINQTGEPDPSAGCAATDPVPASTMGATFRSGDKDRIYNITVPTAAVDRAEPVPLVVNLHGATGTARGQDLGTAFPEVAEEKGFVVLTPEAEQPGRLFDIGRDRADVTLVDELLDQTTAELCIDQNRIYLAGFSVGGMMSMSMACAEPDRYAAIAVVGGIFDPPVCERDVPVPLVAFHGTDDDVVRPDGTYTPDIAVFLGAGGPTREALAAKWATANGCSADPPSASTQESVTEFTFACPTGSEVEFYRINGGTHTWPGGRPVGYVTGNPSPADGSMDATQVIWDFFDGFQR